MLYECSFPFTATPEEIAAIVLDCVRTSNGSIEGAIGDRAHFYWPIRDPLDSGANVAAGSDWPSVAEHLDPWPAMELMVTRRNPYTDGKKALWPEQAIPKNVYSATE